MFEEKEYDPAIHEGIITQGNTEFLIPSNEENLNLHEIPLEERRKIARVTKLTIKIKEGMLGINLRTERVKAREREVIDGYKRGLALLKLPEDDQPEQA